MALTHYQVLGIAESASPDDVRKAFKRKALETHPDKMTSVKDGSEKRAIEAKFHRVHEAFEILRDPDKRRMYDESIRRKRRPLPTAPTTQSSSNPGARNTSRPSVPRGQTAPSTFVPPTPASPGPSDPHAHTAPPRAQTASSTSIPRAQTIPNPSVPPARTPPRASELDEAHSRMQATRRAWIELSDAAHRARMQERERELEAQKAALAREAARKKAAAAEEKRKRDEEARAAQIRKKQEEEERRKATMKKCMSVFLEALETEMAACNKTWSKSPQGFNQEAKEKRDSKISVDRKQDRVKPTRSQTMI